MSSTTTSGKPEAIRCRSLGAHLQGKHGVTAHGTVPFPFPADGPHVRTCLTWDTSLWNG
jgi:hypothetical protein